MVLLHWRFTVWCNLLAEPYGDQRMEGEADLKIGLVFANSTWPTVPPT